MWDYIYKSLYKIYECILKSENSKLCMQVRMSQDDCQFILGNSISQIFARLYIFNTDKKNECERVIEMIKEWF